MAQKHHDGMSRLVIISLKTSLPFPFLLLLYLPQNTQPVGLLFFIVPSAVKLKEVCLASNAATLTTSTRQRLHNMVDDHFLWCLLKHRFACSIFSVLCLSVQCGPKATLPQEQRNNLLNLTKQNKSLRLLHIYIYYDLYK